MVKKYKTIFAVMQPHRLLFNVIYILYILYLIIECISVHFVLQCLYIVLGLSLKKTWVFQLGT